MDRPSQQALSSPNEILPVMDKFSPLVKKYARKLPAEEREDFMQDLWVVLLHRTTHFDRTRSVCLSTFLYPAIRNSLITYNRRKFSRVKTPPRFVPLDPNQVVEYSDFPHEILLRWLLDSISSSPLLTKAERKILSLSRRYFSNKEIQDLLGMSESAVHTHKHQIRKKLQPFYQILRKRMDSLCS